LGADLVNFILGVSSYVSNRRPDERTSILLKEYTETDNRLNSHAIWLKYEILCIELEQQLNVQKETVAKSGYETRVIHEKGKYL